MRGAGAWLITRVVLAAAILGLPAVPARAEVLFTNHGLIGTTVTRLPGGSLLVGGDAEAGGAFAVVKLTAGGRPERRFGRGGFVALDVANASFNDASGLIVLPGGRILETGTAGTDNAPGGAFNGTSSAAAYGVARFTAAGRVDRTFGHGRYGRNGWQLFTPNPDNAQDDGEFALRMPDGRIMLGGSSQPQSDSEACAFSFDADLVPTPGFTPPCYDLAPGGGTAFVHDAAADATGTVLALSALTASNHLLLGAARIGTDGQPDRAFGVQGRTVIDMGPVAKAVNQASKVKVLPRPGGGWVLAGSGPRELEFIGLTATGALDPSFGSGGVLNVNADGSPARDVLFDLLPAGGGRVVALAATELQRAGSSTKLELVRITSGGRRDTSFGHGGTRVLSAAQLRAPGIAQLDAAAPVGRSGFVVVGASHPGSSYGLLAVKLSWSGRVDARFGR